MTASLTGGSMEKYFIIQTHEEHSPSVKEGYAVLIQFLENIPWCRLSQTFSIIL
jgi:hypothetical protein